jgi:hypothetical protein
METNVFNNEKGLIFGMSEKIHGDMKVWPGEGNTHALANRRNFFESKGLAVGDVISALVVHGDKIFTVKEKLGGYYADGYDALITNVPGVILAITAADCSPILFSDPINKVVAMAHSGWRGTVLNIAEKTVKAMVSQYGSLTTDIEVFIGPHIRACHFQVGSETAQQFSSSHVIKRDDNLYVDLGGVILDQLLRAGLLIENMSVSHECTFCDEKYFSFRRDKPERVQAGIAYLGLR